MDVLAAPQGRDHGGYARHLVLPEDASLRTEWREVFGDGQRLSVIVAAARGRVLGDELTHIRTEPQQLSAIPYALWAQRGSGEMRVWIPELAELPGMSQLRRVGNRFVSASHCYRGDDVTAVLDGRLPASSDDHEIPRHTWWPRRGSKEWIEVRLPARRELHSLSVYWFDDEPRGGSCRVPASWRVLVRRGDSWQQLELTEGAQYGTAKDAFQTLRFRPVRTDRIRLEAQLRPGFSGGVLELKLGTR